MDIYFFDIDKTLYDYDFMKRLPALSAASGVSQYRIASSWWAGGYEKRAEAGEFATSDEYLAAFAEVTGARITLEQWIAARKSAMTPIPGSIAALRRASTLGIVSFLSNNPSIFEEALPQLAPEACEIVGDNRVISCLLGVRKPAPLAFERALAHFDASPADAFFADDHAENADAATAVGMTGHHFTTPELLDAAITAFAGRKK